MWLTILNYNIGQIEVDDVTEAFEENKVALCDDERATDYLKAKGYSPDEVGYMITDECPLCVVNNVETHLNL